MSACHLLYLYDINLSSLMLCNKASANPPALKGIDIVFISNSNFWLSSPLNLNTRVKKQLLNYLFFGERKQKDTDLNRMLQLGTKPLLLRYLEKSQ